MKPREYLATQIAIMNIGQMAAHLKLDEFLMAINTAETVAPIKDPTMLLAAQNNLAIIKNLARSIKEVQNCFFQMRNIQKRMVDSGRHESKYCGNCNTPLTTKVIDCPYCRGEGKLLIERARELGVESGPCPRCQGIGKMESTGCEKCEASEF